MHTIIMLSAIYMLAILAAVILGYWAGKHAHYCPRDTSEQPPLSRPIPGLPYYGQPDLPAGPAIDRDATIIIPRLK